MSDEMVTPKGEAGQAYGRPRPAWPAPAPPAAGDRRP